MISEVIAATEATVDVAMTDHLLAIPNETPPPAGRPMPGDLPDRGIKDLANLLKLLADETRLRIMLYLAQAGELHVRALCDRLKQSQPAVSHHLALLRVAGIVECRRNGKHNFYHVLPERFQRLLEMLFENVPSAERQIRFRDYVLRHGERV
jgi:ArsR family transcriptional regulator